MKKLAILLPLSFLLLACTAQDKMVARTVLDVARSACDLWATQTGLSVQDACKTEEQLRPFVDSILAGQTAATQQRTGTGSCSGTSSATPAASAAP